MRFFFYGTLIDADVRRALLGPHASRRVEPARLQGWRRVAVSGKTYPVVVAEPDASVDGVLVRGLSAAARRRLTRYEDANLYALATVDVLAMGCAHPVSALAFVAKETATRRAPRSVGWSFEDWRRRHKRRLLLTLRRRPAA